MYQLTYKKAELKWRQGFISTKEESIKLKCNEILNKNKKSLTSTTATNENNTNDEESNNHEESEYNEEDTSFFAYNNVNNDTKLDEDKAFNGIVPILNENETSIHKETNVSAP